MVCGALIMTISYKLHKSAIADETPTLSAILLKEDGKVVSYIPLDPDNTDYAEYLEWAKTNTPEAAD